MERTFTNVENQEVFDKWLEWKSTKVKASGLPQYRSGAFAVEDAIADKSLNNLTPFDVANAYGARTKKQSHTATFLLDCFSLELIDLSTDTLRYLLNKDNYTLEV